MPANRKHGLIGKVNNPKGRNKKRYPTRPLYKRVDARFYMALLELLIIKEREMIAASDDQESMTCKMN